MGEKSPIRTFLLFLVLIFVKNSHSSSFDPSKKLSEFNQKIESTTGAPTALAGISAPTLSSTALPPKLKLAAATSSSSSSESESVSNAFAGIKHFDRVFYPTGYGADFTGTEDSFDAIMSAIGDAIQLHNGGELLPEVKDLGGVVIDLLGGNYIISKPLQLPPFIGNIVIQSGTIRASPVFPGDRHLFELQSVSPWKQQEPEDLSNSDEFSYWKKNNGIGIFYEDITFRDILFDSSLRGGGIAVVDSARVRIDHCFFIHFTTQGIMVKGGHETFISSSYFGQHLTIGGDKREKTFTGTAIVLNGNDNAVTDVVIFSAGVGIEVGGQANIITGVHCYNKATWWGGIGILVRLPGLSQTRISNCYMDYTAIVLEDPVQVHVTNSFFLGDANIVLKSVHGRISALNIVDNMFSGDTGNPIVKLEGEFKDVDQVVVDRNNVNGKMTLKATVGRRTVGQSSPGKWTVDFSSILLFRDKIHHVQYGFIVKGDLVVFPTHGVSNVSENVVTISANREVDSATVSVVVDQYNLVGESVV